MDILFISLVALAAFFLKGITGTGTTTVVVALGSLFIDPKLTIVLASFVNIFGGLAMLRVDTIPLDRWYWIPISLVMGLGIWLGNRTFHRISETAFRRTLGLFLIFVSLRLLMRGLGHAGAGW